jgi:hypothetical protein
MRLTFKPNCLVIWTSTNLAIAEAFCQACTDLLGPVYLPTLTSGMDGAHTLESGHYYGRALDFRRLDMPEQTDALWQIKLKVEEYLGTNYLCLLEADHYHIQRQKNSF